MRGTGGAQTVAGVPACEHPGDDAGPGPLAALDLTGGAGRECRLADILDAYPVLTSDEVHAALRFARAHEEETLQAIRASEEAWR